MTRAGDGLGIDRNMTLLSFFNRVSSQKGGAAASTTVLLERPTMIARGVDTTELPSTTRLVFGLRHVASPRFLAAVPTPQDRQSSALRAALQGTRGLVDRAAWT